MLKNVSFNDVMSLEWDAVEKTAISIRDGVLKYSGSEIGHKPLDKIFTVYRSPATIANVASRMVGIPVTDDHVELESEVKDSFGIVKDAVMIDHVSDIYSSMLAIRNKIKFDNHRDLDIIPGRELSLGYKADLVKHDECDFEQINIVPHHLAMVEKGRCGAECSFLDKQEVNRMKKRRSSFTDQDEPMNLEGIVKVAQEFQEALKKAPLEMVAKMVPTMKEIIDAAKVTDADLNGVDDDVDAAIAEEVKGNGEDISEAVEEAVEEEKEDDVTVSDTEEEVLLEDADDEKSDKEKETPRAKFADKKTANAFKDAIKTKVLKAVKQHGIAIEKACEFLGESYVFKDKSTEQIMRDTIKIYYPDETFLDKELPLMFKAIRKQGKTIMKVEGHSKDPIDELQDKEF